MPALGERFRAAREARGLSLSDVSEQIHIRSVYLAAIEDENWGAMGAPVYARGFLKTYARFLGLDPEDVLAAIDPRSLRPASYHDPMQASELDPDLRPPSKNLSPLIWIAALIAVALIAFVVYNEFTLQRVGTVVAASPASGTSSTTPSPSAPAEASTSPAASALPAAGLAELSPSPAPSPSPGAGGAQSLQVVLSATSWLRVAVDGSVSMEGTFPAGTSKLFHGKTALLRIGNAGGVNVYVDGKSIGALGKPGDVVERAFAL